ncbi:MAG: glycosyltransferase involved in cell wall biosynthesis [Psychroserpens sp.]
MKKVKIFLGGYINSTNAQNINCRSIANHLNKNKFDVCALELYSGNLSSLPKNIVKTFTCSYPHRISQYIGFLWGIYQCDIAFLPKGECHKWNMLWLTFLRKKYFTTIEGILDETNIQKAIKRSGTKSKVLKKYNDFKNLYSITSFMKKYNLKHHDIKSSSKILYLGTETHSFTLPDRVDEELKNIIIIGNHLKYKGINDYFKLAKDNPSLTFHIVGSGNGEIDVKNEIEKQNLLNCIYHGSLSHIQLHEQLKNIQLHIFPSRTEGFPKVTLETAAAGIPSVVYSDYGASEWIEDHENGFVVDSLDKIQLVIDEILVTPELLAKTSKNAINLAKRFDWKTIIKDWEKEVATLYEI